jgi:uncharacterized membrane protein
MVLSTVTRPRGRRLAALGDDLISPGPEGPVTKQDKVVARTNDRRSTMKRLRIVLAVVTALALSGVAAAPASAKKAETVKEENAYKVVIKCTNTTTSTGPTYEVEGYSYTKFTLLNFAPLCFESGVKAP